jgi:hypothetical protein
MSSKQQKLKRTDSDEEINYIVKELKDIVSGE